MLGFIPLHFPTVYFLDKKGLKMGICLGITFTTLGCWFRCLINHSFNYVIIGSMIIAIGQPFIYNAPTKVSAFWFPEKERVYATTIGANASLLGITIGYLFP